MQLVTGELSDARAEAGSPLGPAKWHPGLLERCQRAWQLERRPRGLLLQERGAEMNGMVGSWHRGQQLFPPGPARNPPRAAQPAM